MAVILHRAGARGAGDFGWLTTRYSFNFAHWYDSSRMGFGALRVLNDDRITGGAGFPPHNHRDMEIVTIVTEGAVRHRDSLGNEGVVSVGEVQAMSAGTGVTHAEYNASESEELALFQLWIDPAAKGGEPRYAQMRYDLPAPGSVIILAAPEAEKETALPLRQEAYIHRGTADAKHPLTYTLHTHGNGVYLFVISGHVRMESVVLGARDALGISDAHSITIEAETASDFLLIEVPLI